MRYYIIFGVTLVVCMFILFYPKNYLYKYTDRITIDYNELTDDDLWIYESTNDNLKLENSAQNIWTFTPNKDGKVTLTFYYKKENDNFKYKIIYDFLIKGNKIIWKSGEALGLFDYPNPY